MDAIAAISTAQGASGIGIVRVSGDGAISASSAVFKARNGKPLSGAPDRFMTLGALLDRQGREIDSVLAVVFRAPGSYTGEDLVELHCHGSQVVLNECLAALFAAGARQAKAGEFTKRAFLNGHMDLTQAEAVVDLIDAETAEAAAVAASQLGGAILRPVSEVYDKLTDITSRFYAVVDYPDEDIEDLEKSSIEKTLADCGTTLSRLLATAERGRIVKHGVRAAIIGKPNAGKSSLLNALLGYDRAIVTPTAGTTRDTVEEKLICGGVLLRLIDTAGIRDTADPLEKLGVERSKAALETAGLVFAVVDGSATPPVTPEDAEILSLAAKHKNWILVWSKADLFSGGAPVFLPREKEGFSPPATVVAVSAVTGEGLTELEAAVAGLFPAGHSPGGSAVLTNERQISAVSEALAAIKRAEAALVSGMTPDAVLTDAEEAMDALGSLTGKVARDDIVSAIFSRFCVGK